jgi:hypothetical protein
MSHEYSSLVGIIAREKSERKARANGGTHQEFDRQLVRLSVDDFA